MTFTGLEQIRQAFGLTITDPTEIRKQLRQLQAQLHPDKHAGDFASTSDKETYLKIDEAIQFLDSYKEENTALVPLSAVTELIKVVRDLVPATQVATAETQLSAQVAQRISEIGSRYLAPKITLSAVTAVLTAVWFFPSTMSEHPVLKQYLNVASPQFVTVWLMSLALTALAWYIFKSPTLAKRDINLG